MNKQINGAIINCPAGQNGEDVSDKQSLNCFQIFELFPYCLQALAKFIYSAIIYSGLVSCEDKAIYFSSLLTSTYICQVVCPINRLIDTVPFDMHCYRSAQHLDYHCQNQSRYIIMIPFVTVFIISMIDYHHHEPHSW